MGNTVVKITSKIVEFTGNEATKAFIGKIVTRKTTSNGIIYAIGSTGYFLKPAEYKKFAEAGAIAQASLIPNKKKTAKKVAPTTKAKVVPSKVKKQVQAKQKLSESAPLTSAAKSKKVVEKIPATESSDIAVAAYVEEETEEKFELGSEEHQTLLETSEFLINYPSPAFELDTPKHMGLFDKRDDFKERVTGFFDRIGREGRDKLVDAISE